MPTMIDTVRIDHTEFDELNDYSYKNYYDNLNSNIEDLPEKERIQQYRYFCLWDTYYLLRYGCNMPVVDVPYAYARCQEVDDIEFNKGGLRDWLFLWFREGFKSTILTKGKVIQHILKFPEKSHLIFSDTNPGAKDFLLEIKIELERNEWLQNIFPEVLYKDPQSQKNHNKWSLDDGITVKRKTNRKEPTVKACGLTDGSMPTKFHVEYLVYDDAVTEESVRTEDRIEKTKKKIRLSYALGKNIAIEREETTAIRFIGTRYDDGDAYGDLEESGEYKISKHPWYLKDKGKKVPRAHSMGQIRTLRKRMSPYIFACQYELDPVPRGQRKFKTGLSYYKDRSDEWNYILLVDPAGSGKEKRGHDRDNTAMAVIGRDFMGKEYLADGVYDVLIQMTDRIDKVFELVRKYNIEEVWYERVGMQADTQAITNKMNRDKLFFALNEFIPNRYGSKNDRIESALMPRIENRRFFVPEILEYTDHNGRIVDIVDVIRTELKRFPHGKHDDMIDCLSQLIAVDPVGRDNTSSYSNTEEKRWYEVEEEEYKNLQPGRNKNHRGPLVYI